MIVACLLVLIVFRIREAELPIPGSQRGRWEPAEIDEGKPIDDEDLDSLQDKAMLP